MRLPRKHVLAPALFALALAPVLTPAPSPAAAAPVAAPAIAAPAAAPRAAAPHQIAYHQFDSTAEWRTGTQRGTRVHAGRLSLQRSFGIRRYDGTAYEQASWASPWVSPGHSLTRLIASWSALTPGDSWVEVTVRGRNAAGTTSSWDVLGRWAAGDTHIKRSSVDGQPDDLAGVNVDTLETAGLTSYQLRVTLMRRKGTRVVPSFDTVGAVSSRLPSGPTAVSTPGPGRGVVLDVPRFSQMIHRGHYPQWGNGGQAWCSPTSTSMVLGYYDALPPAKAYRWVPKGHPDPEVDLAARSTFDYSYDGTGNWPFNTAYAAPRAGKAFVTRLASLRDAERFIVKGIPVIASISFGAGDLDGTPISATNGHLLVIVGFTQDGDVVVNDPAASNASGVRRTYDRAQFEDAWLPTSGGTAYIIRDAAHPLPGGRSASW